MREVFFWIILIVFSSNSLFSQTVTKEELQAGDIIMYNGNSVISKLIMFFDGGSYSHTGIYDGEQVLEAVGEGVKSFSLEESITGVNYADVYRYKGLDSAARESLISVINKYKNSGDRYSYEQFMLLGALTITRKAPVLFLAPVLRSLLDRSGKVFADILANEKQPMICSELVYRCYREADTTEKIKLNIVETKISRGSVSDIAVKFAVLYLEKAAEDIDEEWKLLKSELERFKSNYTNADPSRDMDWSEPDFVTPHDLENSPSLVKVGRLSINY